MANVILVLIFGILVSGLMADKITQSPFSKTTFPSLLVSLRLEDASSGVAETLAFPPK